MCLCNWKEEAGNGRKAILLIQKVHLDKQNKGKPMAGRVPRVLRLEASDWGQQVLYLEGISK